MGKRNTGGTARMRRQVTLLLASALILTSCGTVRESRFNPFNWFGNSRSAPIEATDDENALIPRRNSIFARREAAAYAGQPIGEITELLVEPRPGGAILRASGVADRAGPFDVRLVKEDEASDAQTLTYSLRVLQAPGPRDVGPWARTVTAAVPLTFQDLRGIRTIRVQGARNQRVTSR